MLGSAPSSHSPFVLRHSFPQDLRKQRLDTFMAGFSVITMKLKEMYQMITLGGDAELELVDRLNPFSEGIVFSVRPPKKSWKNISNLSGGEKTLSSLALVFALHHYKPTPLYVMDEIDAALDFKNVSIVANYIKERTKNAQFIIISLRNNMFEVRDRLRRERGVGWKERSSNIPFRDPQPARRPPCWHLQDRQLHQDRHHQPGQGGWLVDPDPAPDTNKLLPALNLNSHPHPDHTHP